MILDVDSLRETLFIMAAFALIVIASRDIGQLFRRLRLPLISGFLFVGILAGPSVLDVITLEATDTLHFLEEVSLAFIAFAAGTELYLKELRSRLTSIKWVTGMQTVAIFVLGTAAFFLLSERIPALAGIAPAGRVAVGMLAGTILVARSPSSAIAIINELRARGPFTQTVMGATVVTDIIVIVLFAISSETADAFLTDLGFNLAFIGLLVGELLISLLLGILVSLLLRAVLQAHLHRLLKELLVLVIGYGVFITSTSVRAYTHEHFAFEVLLEPLLICMIGSFFVANYSPFRDDLLQIMQELAPSVFVVFFTLTGATLRLEILATVWQLALALFVVRLIGLFLGSLAGGSIAGDPAQHNRLSWLAYVTQAGVGLGLAREVAFEFESFGAAFATLVIAVIVVNQLIGPPLMKLAINRVGEAHTRADTPAFDGTRDAVIFGVDGQSVALAHQLGRHGWNARLVCLESANLVGPVPAGLDIREAVGLTMADLSSVGLGQAEVVVAMLSDAENYQICEQIFEHVGTPTVVARLSDRAHQDRFQALGVLTVHPSTAIVGLLDHFVRAPATASLLTGLSERYDVVDVNVMNPDLDGLLVRELRLPLDTLMLSLARDGQTIISHGYTEIRVGDAVTLLGSPESLEEVALRFET